MGTGKILSVRNSVVDPYTFQICCQIEGLVNNHDPLRLPRYGLLAGSLLSGYFFLRTRIEQRLMHKRDYHWMLYGKPYGAVLTILKDLVEDGKVVPIVDGVYR